MSTSTFSRSINWRRLLLRALVIDLIPAVMQSFTTTLVLWRFESWDMVWNALAQPIQFGPLAVCVALTLELLQRDPTRPIWASRLILFTGLMVSTAARLLPTWLPVLNEVSITTSLIESVDSVRLYATWQGAILAVAATIYLGQRSHATDAELRVDAMQLQLQQVRRRMRAIRGSAGSARLDPTVLFDSLVAARAEFERTRATADARLDRLTTFLRQALSSTTSAGSTVEKEFDLLRSYVELAPSHTLRVSLSDTPTDVARAEVAPGLLMPLLQCWLGRFDAGAGGASGRDVRDADAGTCDDAGSTMAVSAWLAGASPPRLCLRLSGPQRPMDTALVACREQLADLYGNHASVRVRQVADRQDIDLVLPIERHL